MEDNNKELNTPDNSVPRSVDVAEGEGGGNDSVVKSLAEVVNHEWGTNFKDDAAALKGLQDNAMFRGKLGKYRPFIEKLETTRGGENQALKYMEDITKDEVKPVAPQSAPSIDPAGFVSKDQYERDVWFSKNPAYAPYEELVSALKVANPGKSYDEVKELPALKTLVDKANEADEIKNARQPLTSSSRVYANQPAEKRAEAWKQAKETKDFGKFVIEQGMVDIPKGVEDIK